VRSLTFFTTRINIVRVYVVAIQKNRLRSFAFNATGAKAEGLFFDKKFGIGEKNAISFFGADSE